MYYFMQEEYYKMNKMNALPNKTVLFHTTFHRASVLKYVEFVLLFRFLIQENRCLINIT